VDSYRIEARIFQHVVGFSNI